MSANGKQWPQPPAMTIDPKKHYRAVLKTARGSVEVELLAGKAPETVNSFTFLAREGFYDNTTFSGRVMRGVDVLRSLTTRDPQQSPRSMGDVLRTVEIHESAEGS